MTPLALSEELTLPRATDSPEPLAGRVWRPDVDGPSVVSVRADGVFDVSADFPTMRDLCEHPSPAEALRRARGSRLGNDYPKSWPTPRRRNETAGRPYLLAPIDLQAIKAAGVTFARSLLERVIEERAHGNPERAQATREAIVAALGDELRGFKPGSPAAMRLKEALIEAGAWSQYLEVGIGPDAEVFTKGQPMSAVGCGDDAGLPQRLTLEQSRAGGGARRRVERPHRRRDPRQRRQPARFRGTIGAPVGQGEGPERELRDRSVPSIFRRDIHARRRPHGDDSPEGRGRGRVSPRRPARRWRK